jgi:DNA processing protein
MVPNPSVIDAPLSVIGDARLLDPRRAVALVGSRAASGRGLVRARELAAALARVGRIVASGGALGIDSAAHEGALAAGGPTVAVVAGGVRTPYPARNRKLFDEIIFRGGAVASPFGDSTAVRPWHFVRRNQLLAELTSATVVVEAGARSGSMHTVAAALRAGRLVAACPGSPGTEALLLQGAAVIEGPGDLLAALEGRPRHRGAEAPTDENELAVLGALPPGVDRSTERVAEASGLGIRETLRALIALEGAGLVVVTPGGHHRRV